MKDYIQELLDLINESDRHQCTALSDEFFCIHELLKTVRSMTANLPQSKELNDFMGAFDETFEALEAMAWDGSQLADAVALEMAETDRQEDEMYRYLCSPQNTGRI